MREEVDAVGKTLLALKFKVQTSSNPTGGIVVTSVKKDRQSLKVTVWPSFCSIPPKSNKSGSVVSAFPGIMVSPAAHTAWCSLG